MRGFVLAVLRAIAPEIAREVLEWLDRRAAAKADTARELARVKATAAAQSKAPVTEERLHAFNRRLRGLAARYRKPPTDGAG